MGMIQRTRSRTDPYTYVSGMRIIQLGNSTYTSPYTNGYQPVVSSIIDYIHKPGTSREVILPPVLPSYYDNNPPYKYCKNTGSFKPEPISFPAEWLWFEGGYRKYVSVNGIEGARYLPGVLYPATYLTSRIPSLKVSTIPTENEGIIAINSTLEDAKLLDLPQVNILAFIGELKDFKGLVDFFKFKMSTFGKAKNYSDKFLGFEFGVLPLVSDLKNFRELWTKKIPALNKWNEHADKGTILNSHRKFGDVETFGTWSTYYVTSSVIGPLRYDYEFSYYFKSKRIASSYFKPLTATKEDGSSLSTALWGLNAPLAALWQLIPFSFMVDWVTNVGDKISAFEAAKPILQHFVVSCGYSHNAKLIVSCDVYLTVNGYKQRVLRTSEVLKHYERFPILPSKLGTAQALPFEFKPQLSDMKLLLTSAIIHQRL